MDCDEEREGYVSQPRVAYPAIHGREDKQHPLRHPVRTRGEEGFGALIVACGAIWAVYQVIFDRVSPWQLQLYPPSPVEICSLGILIWFHAKWRHSSPS